MEQLQNWQPDSLGENFQALTLSLGKDPDSSGDVQAVLVRYHPEEIEGRPALLWVHGMTDYFFQAHVAQYFHNLGYAFYAIDLRKSGRARQEGELWHYATNFEYYFDDLDAALRVVTEKHPSMVPLAHSTAGLIVSMWLNQSDSKEIPALVLNSPWLDLMNFNRWQVGLLRRVVNVLGKVFPRLAIPGGGLKSYGQSIQADWDYNMTFKPLGGHMKYLGWLRAVLNGQHLVHTDQIDVGVPTLVMTSSRSHLNKPYSAETDTADAVLDVKQIQYWAPHLGKEVSVHTILGARHDVFLSLRRAREEAFSVTAQFLQQHIKQEQEG